MEKQKEDLSSTTPALFRATTPAHFRSYTTPALGTGLDLDESEVEEPIGDELNGAR